MTSSTTPYDWLKSVEPRLVDKRKFAILEFPEEFSWENLGHSLADHFEISEFSIYPGTAKWVDHSDTQSLSSPYTSFRYAVGDFPGDVECLISTLSATQLMTDVICGQPGSQAIDDAQFVESFLHYLSAEILQLLNGFGFRQSLAPRLIDSTSAASSGKVLLIDVQINLFNSSYPIQLRISESLAKAWKQHFTRLGRRQALSEALASQTEILAHLEAGHVTLNQKQWKALGKGDFLLLDNSTIIPGVDKGRVMLTVGGVPLFRCMLKAGQIKLLEHPLYHEVETPMSETDDNEDSTAFDEDENFDELSEDNEHVDLESESGDEEDSDLETDNTQQGMEVQAEDDHASEERELTPAEKIPLTIVIEVGRLKMTLSKLRDLQPGQLMEIDVNPEEGVDLVINGACVGRGELLRIGETLGVRILELG